MSNTTIGDKRSEASGKLVSIIVPTYQEAENLPLLIPAITSAMQGRRHEIVIVDDNSRDGSDKIVADLAAAGHCVRMLVRTDERGLSTAVIHGFRNAKGDVLVCMDADMSHPPDALGALVDAVGGKDGECDFALGSRYVPGGSTEEGWGAFRWLNSKVATLMARPFTAAKDPMSGFFALPRSVFERAAQLNPLGYKIGLEVIVKCGCRAIREVPIHFKDRKLGHTKLSLAQQINYLAHLKRLADFKFGWFSHFMQFSLVGATGMVVDLTIYGSLLAMSFSFLPSQAKLPIVGTLTHEGIHTMLSRAVAIFVAMNWNFLLNRRVTFSYSRNTRKRVQYPKFLASNALGLILSWSVSVALPHYNSFFDDHKLMAAVVGIGVGLVSNFLCSRHWVFRHKPIAEDTV